MTTVDVYPPHLPYNEIARVGFHIVNARLVLIIVEVNSEVVDPQLLPVLAGVDLVVLARVSLVVLAGVHLVVLARVDFVVLAGVPRRGGRHLLLVIRAVRASCGYF